MTTVMTSPGTTIATSEHATEAPTTVGTVPGGPDFHVGVRGRIALAFAGLMLPAAAFLYFYGQLSPGV